MKTKFILLLFFFSKFLFAQDLEKNDKIIYLDAAFVVTDEANHVYYRIVKDYNLTKSEYSIIQYFKSGKKEGEGISTLRDFPKQKGVYIRYYENENKKSSTNYDNDGNKSGDCTFWYANGEIEFEAEFIKSISKIDGFERPISTLKINNFWNTAKVQTTIDGNGDFTDNGYFDNFDDNSISNGKLINGYKDGVWSGNNSKLGITFTEDYKNGKLISGKSIDSNKLEYSYDKISVNAEGKDGIMGFYKYVGKKMVVPENIGKGKIVTQFTISVTGEISNLKVIRGLRDDADREAIRVISNYKDFIPAKLRGINIKSNYTFPITIQGS